MPKISASQFRDKNTQLYTAAQAAFRGGMNLLDDLSNIDDDQYGIGFNFSNRQNKLEPFKADIEIADYITGKKHGIYGIANYLIVFADGYAWYRIPSGEFNKIPNFRMSRSAERYYIALVPASIINISRYLSQATDSESVLLNPTEIINTTPQALLVQDGENQPWIIFLDGSSNVTARLSQTYEQWTLDYLPEVNNGREYVPIGCDMLWMEDEGLLLIVSADRKSLYRSVIGRPLDCVVAIDATGNKGGDANTTNYRVSYANIVAIANGGSGQIIVSTDAPATHLLSLSYDRTIFAQPTFIRKSLFSININNSFSFVDILGDIAMITPNGIRSFNATKTLFIDSENTILSRLLHDAYNGILQTSLTSAAIDYKDYALFATMTNYGPLIAIYDKTIQKWASFIRLVSSNFNIKQFASLVPYSNNLFAITTDDKIIELFGSSDYYTAFVQSKEQAFDEPSIEHKTVSCVVLIGEQVTVGSVVVSAYADSILAQTGTRDLQVGGTTIIAPGVEVINSKNTKRFEWSTSPRVGYELGHTVQWSGGGKLNCIEHLSEVTTPMLNQKESSLV